MKSNQIQQNVDGIDNKISNTIDLLTIEHF